MLEMTDFRYQALDSDQKHVAGELQAESVQQAIAQLEADGLTLLSIEVAVDLPSRPDAERSTDDFTSADAASNGIGVGVEREVLRSHMARVLERGRAIAPALRAYSEEMPSTRRRRQLLTVIEVLEHGNADEAAAALAALPEYWIPLLSAATSSRDPARVLREFLYESQQADDLRRQRWLTLAYPIAIASLAAAVMTALSFFVIPIFREMFYGFGLQLPYLTEVVLTVADWIVSGRALVVLAVIVAFGLLLWLAKRWFPSTGRWLGDRWNLPFGRTTAIARFARFTADLIESGLAIPDALRVAAFTSHRGRLRRGAWQLARDIEQGESQPPIDSWHPLTASIGYALQSNLPLGTRIHVLREISQCHADRARMRLSWTRGMAEPITIAVVGLFVGTIVIALFLPLVKLVEGLSH